MRTLFSRLLDLVLRRQREDRLSEEIQAHLDLLTDEHIAKGLSPADARLAARKAFGGVDQVKERYRDQRGLPLVDTLVQDLRFAGRLLRREPIFALAAALSLGIGIGANTAIFTIGNSLLFRQLPGVADGDRLVDISRRTDGNAFGVNQISFPNFLDLRERITTTEDLCAYQPIAEPMSLAMATGSSGAERVFGQTMTPNCFSVLGVGATTGRLFDPLTAHATIVLSHRFWSRRFKQDPAIVGQTLRLNGQAHTIVGVAAEAFASTSLLATDLWVPVDMNPAETSGLRRRDLYWGVVRGRLKDGVTTAQAAAEVDAIGRALAREYPDNQGTGFRLASASWIPGNLAVPVAGVLTLILAFVSLVLAAACANLSGLLLARASSRRREIAVRLAMGAGRGRLVRQLLTETMILFVLGGAIGIALARGMTSVILSMLPALPVPLEIGLPLDIRVIGFTAGMSLVAAIVSGLAPALAASKTDVISSLKNDAPGMSGRPRLRQAFVIAQVAFSIVLVVGTGVFTRALQAAVTVDSGFEAREVAVAELDLALGGYTPLTGSGVSLQLLERVRALPAVESASVAAILPTGGRVRLGHLSLPGTETGGNQPLLNADWNAVATGYFATLRIPLVAGRDFDGADAAGTAPVAIVSEGAARRFWPGDDPLGKFLVQHPAVLMKGQPNTTRTLQVVGVARDVRSRTDGSPPPQIYLPLQQHFMSQVSVVARSADQTGIAAAIRGAVASVDPNLPVLSFRTLEESAAISRLPRRVAAFVSSGLGLVSLLLAVIGIYGVTTYAVTQRTREIGIRVALGATHTSVVGMIVGTGMRLVLMGSAIGLAAAAIVNGLLPRLLAGFPDLDLVAFVWAVTLFAVTGIAACYLPARRAARLDPAATLRND